jgi:hypothetical protein
MSGGFERVAAIDARRDRRRREAPGPRLLGQRAERGARDLLPRAVIEGAPRASGRCLRRRSTPSASCSEAADLGGSRLASLADDASRARCGGAARRDRCGRSGLQEPHQVGGPPLAGRDQFSELKL